MNTLAEVEASRRPQLRLKELRARYGLSVSDLAKCCGISQYAVLRAELGKALQPTDTIKIAGFFEMTVEQLWAEGYATPQGPQLPQVANRPAPAAPGKEE